MPSASSKIGSTSRNGLVTRDTARFTGGGAAANFVKVYGDNVRSITYNAATGKYLVTFNDVQGGVLKFASVQVHPATTAANVVARLIFSSFSLANKTIELETYTDAGAAVAVATTATVTLEFEWGSA